MYEGIDSNFWIPVAGFSALILALLVLRRLLSIRGRDEISSIDAELLGRYSSMKGLVKARMEYLKELHGDTNNRPDERDLSVSDKLIAVDVFVEKAKHKLTLRANLSFACAMLSFLGTVTVCGGFLVWVTRGPAASIPFIYILFDETWLWLTFIIKSLTTGAMFLAGIYITSSLGKGFLNEWSMLMSRRHALRFGRIAVYLSDGNMKIEDLVDVFGWNINPPSSFGSFRPEHVTKGIIGQLTGIFQKGVEVGTKAAGQKKGDD